MIKPLNSLEEKIIWRARSALGPSLKAFDINHGSTGAVVMKATWQDGISGSFVVTEEEFYRGEEQVMYRVEAGLNELAHMDKKHAAEIERRLRAEADRMAEELTRRELFGIDYLQNLTIHPDYRGISLGAEQFESLRRIALGGTAESGRVSFINGQNPAPRASEPAPTATATATTTNPKFGIF